MNLAINEYMISWISWLRRHAHNPVMVGLNPIEEFSFFTSLHIFPKLSGLIIPFGEFWGTKDLFPYKANA